MKHVRIKKVLAIIIVLVLAMQLLPMTIFAASGSSKCAEPSSKLTEIKENAVEKSAAVLEKIVDFTKQLENMKKQAACALVDKATADAVNVVKLSKAFVQSIDNLIANSGTCYLSELMNLKNEAQKMYNSLAKGFSWPTASTTYVIEATASAGGEVVPGNGVFPANADVVYTFKPFTGYAVANVTVDGVNYGAIPSYTFANLSANHSVAVTFKKVNAYFDDVNPSSYYSDPIIWAIENGIAEPLSAYSFGPDVACTRAEMVMFLWRAAGSPVLLNMTATGPASDLNPFTDVNRNDPFYDAVVWGVLNGYVAGTTQTTFSPFQNVTRAQAMAFLWRVMGKPGHTSLACPFTDVGANRYYFNAVMWAYDNQITSGITVNQFAPDNSCTRGQIISFIYRLMVK